MEAHLNPFSTPPTAGTTRIAQANTRTTTTTTQTTVLDDRLTHIEASVHTFYNGQPFNAVICCDLKCRICDHGNIGMLHADGDRSVFELKRSMLYLARHAGISELLSIFWCRIKENPLKPVWVNKRHFVIEKGNLEYAMMYLGGKGNKKQEWIKKQNGIDQAQRAMRCVLRDWEKFESCRRQRVIRQEQAMQKRREERRQTRLLQARKEQAKKMKKEHMKKKSKKERKPVRKTTMRATKMVEQMKEVPQVKEAEKVDEAEEADFDRWAVEFLKGEPQNENEEADIAVEWKEVESEYEDDEDDEDVEFEEVDIEQTARSCGWSS